MEDKIKWPNVYYEKLETVRCPTLNITASGVTAYKYVLDSQATPYAGRLRSKSYNHGDVDRAPDCCGWWIHVELDEVTGDPTAAELLYVTTPTTYIDSKGEELPIDSLPKGDSHIYVFLW